MGRLQHAALLPSALEEAGEARPRPLQQGLAARHATHGTEELAWLGLGLGLGLDTTQNPNTSP